MAEYYMDDLKFQSIEEYEQARKDDFDTMFIILGELKNGKVDLFLDLRP